MSDLLDAIVWVRASWAVRRAERLARYYEREAQAARDRRPDIYAEVEPIPAAFANSARARARRLREESGITT